MTTCFFVSDLHGQTQRYEQLFRAIIRDRPQAVFLGGDLFPTGWAALTGDDSSSQDFVNEYLAARFMNLREQLAEAYPRVFLILGNDDGRWPEVGIRDGASRGLWEYIHNRKTEFGNCRVYGYAYIPPTPFLLKDWERYDVSRYVDPGCVSPEEGAHSIPVAEDKKKYTAIQEDLLRLAGEDDVGRAVFLFHSPPYKSKLDRAALGGKMVDHVPLDVDVGSIAIRRLIEKRQPLVTLHGHVHESARLTGSWQDQIGRTRMFSAAHDGPELALVRFDPDNLAGATRELL